MKLLRKERVGKTVFDADLNKWFVSKLDSQSARKFKVIFPDAEEYDRYGLAITASLWNTVQLLWFTMLYPLSISNNDRKILNAMADQFRASEQNQKDRTTPDKRDSDSCVGLRDEYTYKWFQKEGIDYIDFTRNGIVLYDVGVGKTLIGLGIATLKLGGPVVLVVEPHLSEQMAKDCRKFTIFKCYEVEGTQPYDLPEDVDIYIFKYTQLDGWQEYLSQGWVGAIAFDEVQNLRGGTRSARGAAADRICDHVPVVVGLTATLIFNKGLEAFSIAKIFNNDLFGSRQDFIDDWCNGNSDGYVIDPDALGEYMQKKGFLHRRTKADCGIEAKQTHPKIEFVKSDGNECPEIVERARDLARQSLESDQSGVASPQSLFRQTMYQLTGIAKARGVARQVRQFIDAGTPVLLFGYHAEVFNIWKRELADLRPAVINGQVTCPNTRETEKQRFINGDTDICLMGIGMGAGMNDLETRCSTVVLGELCWSPSTIIQAIGRLDRGAQELTVYVYYYISVFGIDRRILEVLERKEGQRGGIERSNCVDEVDLEQDPTAIYSLEETRDMAQELLEGNILDSNTRQVDVDLAESIVHLPMSDKAVQLELLSDDAFRAAG